MATYEDGPNPILTIVGYDLFLHILVNLSLKFFQIFSESADLASASERHERRLDAKEREMQIAYLKGLVSDA